MKTSQVYWQAGRCLIYWLLIIILFNLPNFAFAQQNKSHQSIDTNYKKAFRQLNNNATKLKKRQDKAIAKYLEKFIRQEEKLNKKLCRTNPQLADQLFSYHANPLYHSRTLPTIKGKNATRHNDYYSSELFDSLNTSINSKVKLNETLSNAENQIYDSKCQTNYLQNYLRKRKVSLNNQLKGIPEYEKDLSRFDKANYYFKKKTEYNEELFSAANSKFESEHLLSETLKQKMNGLPINDGLLEKTDKLQSNKVLKGMQDIQETQNLIQSNFPDLVQLDYSTLTDSIGSFKSGFLQKYSKHQFTTPFTFADVPNFKINPLKHLRFADRLKYTCLINPENHVNLLPTSFELQFGVAYIVSKNVFSGLSVSSPIYSSSKRSEQIEKMNTLSIKLYSEHLLLQTIWLYFAI